MLPPPLVCHMVHEADEEAADVAAAGEARLRVHARATRKVAGGALWDVLAVVVEAKRAGIVRETHGRGRHGEGMLQKYVEETQDAGADDPWEHGSWDRIRDVPSWRHGGPALRDGRRWAGFVAVRDVLTHADVGGGGQSRSPNKRVPSSHTPSSLVPVAQSRSGVHAHAQPGTGRRTNKGVDQSSRDCIRALAWPALSHPADRTYRPAAAASQDMPWAGYWALEAAQTTLTSLQGLQMDLLKPTCDGHGMSEVCRIAERPGLSRGHGETEWR